MHRRPLLALLDGLRRLQPADAARIARVEGFVASHADCFSRHCRPGHVTGSAWVVSHDRRSVLLTHHRKLGRWLQLGGHCDDDPDVLAVARREALEESGIPGISLLGGPLGTLPIDVDVHEIPARGDEPAHLHHDVRFLLVAPPDATPQASVESLELSWVRRDRLREYGAEESLLRLERRAQERLARIEAGWGAERRRPQRG